MGQEMFMAIDIWEMRIFQIIDHKFNNNNNNFNNLSIRYNGQFNKSQLLFKNPQLQKLIKKNEIN